MKKTYKMAIVGAGILTFGLTGSAMAFHDGGVAACDGCHTMHNSFENAPNGDESLTTQFSTGPMLLKGNDQSSVCLNCHGQGSVNHSYHVYTNGAETDPSLVPQQEGPGGDFAWLQVGTPQIQDANHEHRGHNIVAVDFGLHASQIVTTSPGGNYPASRFYCSSCHDPHGEWRTDNNGAVTSSFQGATDPAATTPIVESGSYGAVPPAGEAVGAYRLLAGAGYLPKSLIDAGYTNVAFVADPPIAVAPSDYNQADGYLVRVAYGTGMSEWCANCHANFLNNNYQSDGSGIMRHPAGSNELLGSAIAANYNHYVKTGDMNGTQATSYLSLVPFETGETDVTLLIKEVSSTDGPNPTANVMCLSCHRAHASGFEGMLRFELSNTFMVENGVYTGAGNGSGLSQDQIDRAYYDDPASNFAAFQRILCNKCHAKD